MSLATINMMYADYTREMEEVQKQLSVLMARKVGTIRAAQRQLRIHYAYVGQIREALRALGFMPTAAGLVRI